ncbi:MAG: DUF3718 domain-containing protein [Gammaproteobacteria bacterium]|nr:DUF3718 domain-containing protein [Gammaproteobacteria bacterium]MDH5630323.1 DUF3718 domain-containing protein [Gammaproteobacteria bacterium]
MKYFKYLFLAILTSATTYISADTYEFVAYDDSMETKICVAAVKDDVKRYSRLVDNFPLQTRFTSQNHVIISNKLKCNNQNIFKFSQNFGAKNTTAFMSKYIKKSVIIKRDLTEVPEPVLNNTSNKHRVIIVKSDFAK